MSKVIYIDVLIVTNFIINYFLLMLTVKLSRVNLKRIRIVIGSITGSLCSIVILFDTMPLITLNLFKFMLAIVIVLISFKYKNMKNFVKNIIMFYIVSFIFGGIMTAVWLFIMPSNMVMHNGVVYFNYSMTALLICTVIIYFVLNLVIDIYMKVEVKTVKYDVELWFSDKVIKGRGFLDTGNTLKDVYTNKIVIITSFSFIRDTLSKDIIFELENYFTNKLDNITNNGKIKYIPFNSINVSGLLPTIAIDKIVMINKDGIIENNDVLLSISNNDMSGDEYDILLNRLLIN